MKIVQIFNTVRRRLYRKAFPLWQRLVFGTIPRHYYLPIPDPRELKDDLWERRSELVGIDINEEGQLALLSDFSARFRDEYEHLPRNKTPCPYQYYINNDWFGSVDGEILYCMIRYLRPKRIIEIGSGYSTYLSAQAILKNKEEDPLYECEFSAIEPYPNEVLRTGFPGLTRLIPKRAQDIPLSEFEKLSANDILFLDSSHVLRIGSDVQYEFLEILPRLKSGVVVHIHDIFLPAEYPKEWVLKMCRFWNEQYLLQAFLAFNDSFQVLWAASYMHLKHPDKIEAAFSSYKREERRPVSFWIRKTG